MEQHRRAQRLARGVSKIDLAIVQCCAHPKCEEHAGCGFRFPAQIGVGLAGIAVEIDRGADGGP
jgi:hypothetical protein